MKFTIRLTDEEISRLNAGVLGPYAPTMDFALTSEYVEGWEAGQSALCSWFAERLEIQP